MVCLILNKGTIFIVYNTFFNILFLNLPDIKMIPVMKHPCTYLSSLLLCIAITATATDYNTLSLKAERFYKQQEWASALAMYQLMLESQPQQADVYSRAIISATSLRDSSEVLELTNKAFEFHVPFDSIFQNVKAESFALGKTNLYEKYLLGIATHYPWLQRAIDGYLTDYYVFRHDGRKMIEYAKIMLEGLPSDAGFLSILARGYMLNGETELAIETWHNILETDPDNYNALLSLGNYYFELWQKSPSDKLLRNNTSEYLRRAYDIKPTPYISSILKQAELKED